jgi:general secretion pathway protein D
MRFELDGPNLAVMPDAPFLRTYRIDYVNLSRRLPAPCPPTPRSPPAAPAPAQQRQPAGSSMASGGNVSATRIENASRNQFWESVEKTSATCSRNRQAPARRLQRHRHRERRNASSTGVMPAATPRHRNRGGQPQPGNRPPPAPTRRQQNSTTTTVHKATFREAASVIANRETGVVTVRATGRQHEKVREFIDQVMASARRQVLIEATILEVGLSDTYRQGIEWSRLLPSGTRFGITGPSLGSGAGNTVTPFSLAYSSAGGIDSTIRLLEGFGTVKVLSSPKLSVLNNQTAVIKVVEEYVTSASRPTPPRPPTPAP